MNWELAADIATTLGVIVALAGVVVTVVFGVRAERAAATRSERAAALSDENARRAVAALEEMAARGPGATAQVPQRVAWELTHQAGDTYLLQNVGEKPAQRVEVSPTAGANMIFREPQVADLGPGEALTFLAARSMATSDSTIIVAWTQDGYEGRKTWRYPLPPPPPRRKKTALR
jgi:hypothetical protein